MRYKVCCLDLQISSIQTSLTVTAMDPYLTRTLQSLTRSKIFELEKQRSAYETRKAEILATAAECPNVRERVAKLLVGTQELSPGAKKDDEIYNIEHWTEQARYDASIQPERLEGFERHLRNRLDVQSRKLSLADLYSRLLTEWMNPSSDRQESPPSEDGDFEVVEERQKQRLQQLCEQFEAVVFQPCETNPDDITGLLDGLFEGDEHTKDLSSLREEVHTDMEEVWNAKDPFTVESLTKCIKGIQAEDIISEEKQQTLKHFLDSTVALNEIADVLNMRYADLKNWNWDTGDEGVPVLPRQQLNGKYRIWIDDDVLETIFVEHICIRLCTKLKSILYDFVSDRYEWNFHQGPIKTTRDILRRQYYHADDPCRRSVSDSRQEDFMDTFFLASMPGSESDLADRLCGYDEDDDGESRSDADEKPEPKNVRQQLLRKIVTETLFQHQIYGEAAVVQTDLHWFGTSIPHSTVYTILRYAGFPEKWIEFLRKYFETPLNMDKAFDGHEQVGPRKRQRGIPIAHASEKMVGELILFFMDLAVNAETGILLYRLHDDIWFAGEPAECAQAWDVMQRFVKVTGLQINQSKSGSVCLGTSVSPEISSRLPEGPVKIGFLMLDATTGDWVIDQAQVTAHVNQLKTQLEQCDSVISWVRTWNSCIGRFFQNTFGQPAFCFGRPHVDAILSTYVDMYRTIFEVDNANTASTVTEHLKEKISSRFGVSDIPDAFFFFPESLGGLGLRNPFTSMFLIRSLITESPLDLIQGFLDAERKDYEFKKWEYDTATRAARRNRMKKMCEHRDYDPDHPAVTEKDMETYMSFEEWSQFRDCASSRYNDLYERLQSVPGNVRPRRTAVGRLAMDRAEAQFGVRSVDPEMEWTFHLYAEELVRKFGGLNMVEKQFLPVGVLDMIKGKKIRWQMVL